MPTPPDRNIPRLVLPKMPRFQIRTPTRLTFTVPKPTPPPPPSFWHDAAKAAGFAVHTFLADILLIGETPLGQLLPFTRRMEPDDEVSAMAQQFGDIAAVAWGLTEVVAGIGLGLADVGIEGGLMVVPGGQLIAVPGLPVAAGVAVAAGGLVVHGGLVAAVGGYHALHPTQAMSQNQGSTGGGAQPAATAPQTPTISEKIEKQMGPRGWTPEKIQEAIKSGQQIPAVNKATGNPAIRYVHPQTGQSVVVDTVTNEVIHVGGPGFVYGPAAGDVQ